MPQSNVARTSADWVVVANEAAAIIYTCKGRRGPLVELRRIENKQARAKTSELISDKAGRAFDSHGQGRHAMTREKSGPRQQIVEAFARQISGYVDQARQEGRFDDLVLIAAPRFLGLMRKALARTAVSEPYLAIDKDVVAADPQTIMKLLVRAP